MVFSLFVAIPWSVQLLSEVFELDNVSPKWCKASDRFLCLCAAWRRQHHLDMYHVPCRKKQNKKTVLDQIKRDIGKSIPVSREKCWGQSRCMFIVLCTTQKNNSRQCTTILSFEIYPFLLCVQCRLTVLKSFRPCSGWENIKSSSEC